MPKETFVYMRTINVCSFPVFDRHLFKLHFYQANIYSGVLIYAFQWNVHIDFEYLHLFAIQSANQIQRAE